MTEKVVPDSVLAGTNEYKKNVSSVEMKIRIDV